MKNLKIKAFSYQFISFFVIFLPIKILLNQSVIDSSWWASVAAFVVVLVVAPKFQLTKVDGKEVIAMNWIFLKGIRFLK